MTQPRLDVVELLGDTDAQSMAHVGQTPGDSACGNMLHHVWTVPVALPGAYAVMAFRKMPLPPLNCLTATTVSSSAVRYMPTVLRCGTNCKMLPSALVTCGQKSLWLDGLQPGSKYPKLDASRFTHMSRGSVPGGTMQEHPRQGAVVGNTIMLTLPSLLPLINRAIQHTCKMLPSALVSCAQRNPPAWLQNI